MLFLLLLMTLTEIGFVVNFTSSPIIFASATILSALLTAFLFRENMREAVTGLCLGILFVLLACFACKMIFDFSYDGNAYHKQAIALLEDGWNPLLGPMEDWGQDAVWGESYGIWINHYAQGVWCIAACFYSVFGDIEISKCYTLILMASASTFIGGFLAYKGIRWWKAAIVALIAAINPLTLAQAFTFYIDAFLMMGLLLLLIGLAAIVVSPNNAPMRRISFIVVASAFIMCTETKFTGFGYAGVFSLSFYILIVIKTIRGSLSKAFLLKTSIFFAAVILSSIFVFGLSPYVMNTLDHGHPFYPLFGPGAVDIMTKQSPASFADSDHLRKLILGFFSETGQPKVANGQEPILKVPLTLHPGELTVLSQPDIRIGGFGVFYSAILLIQIPVIVIFLILQKKQRPLLFQASLCYLIPACILMLILDESWWARYSSYFYFTSPLALLLMFAYHPKKAILWKRYAKIAVEVILAALLAFNTALFLKYNTLQAYRDTQQVKTEMIALKKASQEGKRIQVWSTPLSGAVYSLLDRDIPFEFMGDIKDTGNDIVFDGYLSGLGLNGLAYRIVEK